MSMMVWFDLSILSQLSLVPGHQNTPGLTRMFEVTEHQPGPSARRQAIPRTQDWFGHLNIITQVTTELCRSHALSFLSIQVSTVYLATKAQTQSNKEPAHMILTKCICFGVCSEVGSAPTSQLSALCTGGCHDTGDKRTGVFVR